MFIDFASIRQMNDHTQRSGQERRLFDAALGMLAQLYSHEHVLVFKISTLPDGYPAGFTFPADCTPNKAAYCDRGCCHCEASVAALTKECHFVLDLGKLVRVSAPLHWHALRHLCTFAQCAPMLPDEFEASLETKSFTSKNADLPTVADIYKEALTARFDESVRLDYCTADWFGRTHRREPSGASVGKRRVSAA